MHKKADEPKKNNDKREAKAENYFKMVNASRAIRELPSELVTDMEIKPRGPVEKQS